MATEKRKIHRVVDASGSLVQVLPETSADQVTIADSAGNFSSGNVEGALAELALGIAGAGAVDDVVNADGTSIVDSDKKAQMKNAIVKEAGKVSKSLRFHISDTSNNTLDSVFDGSTAAGVYEGSGIDISTAGADTNSVFIGLSDSGVTAGTYQGLTVDAKGRVIAATDMKYATKQELQEAVAGKARTFTYDDYQAFVTAVDALGNTAMGVGDNVLIKTLNVPDMWVTRVNAVSTLYTYVDDQSIVKALNTTNGLTVGYYTFSQLETTKVDLTDYQTKTDSTLNTTDKTVAGAINEVKKKADANATEISNIKDGTTKAKKADNADNAKNVTININGHAITDIFEKDGTTVKKATSADSATTATTASKLAHPLYFGTYSGSVEKSNGQYLGNKDTSILFSPDFSTAWNEPTQTVVPNTFKVELKDMLTDVNPTAQYSAVKVDEKGRVTAVGKSIEWGTSGQTTPSGDLMIGGLFMELQ